MFARTKWLGEDSWEYYAGIRVPVVAASVEGSPQFQQRDAPADYEHCEYLLPIFRTYVVTAHSDNAILQSITINFTALEIQLER